MRPGFEKLMPEGRPFPYKYLPRRGVALSVTFGEPVSESDVKVALNARALQEEFADRLPLTDQRSADELSSKSRTASGWLGNPKDYQDGRQSEQEVHQTARIRSAVTAVLQRDVEALGRKVMGIVDGT